MPRGRPRELEWCKYRNSALENTMDQWQMLAPHIWLDALTPAASFVGTRHALAVRRSKAHYRCAWILQAGCPQLTLRYKVSGQLEKGFLVTSFWGVSRIPGACRHWPAFGSFMFIENMIVQCAGFGTDGNCKLILLFFFSKNLPSYPCSMALAQAIHDDTTRSGIEFEPTPCGSSKDIEPYIPRVLLATTYDIEYISHRPVLKVAMRPLMEGRDDVKTFSRSLWCGKGSSRCFSP